MAYYRPGVCLPFRVLPPNSSVSPSICMQAPSLAAAPGSQAAAQPFYYNTENAMPQPPTGIGRELKTVKPITPGPSTYVDHFPPKYLEPAQPLQVCL